MQESDGLLLRNQVCFPLYALSKEITNMYRPLLLSLDLTYPQYLVMMVLWEHDGLTVSEIGEKLLLDSGTLTPLLKRLQIKALVDRVRNTEDERVVELFLTEKGRKLKQQACKIPEAMISKMDVEVSELQNLHQLLGKILNKLTK